MEIEENQELPGGQNSLALVTAEEGRRKVTKPNRRGGTHRSSTTKQLKETKALRLRAGAGPKKNKNVKKSQQTRRRRRR